MCDIEGNYPLEQFAWGSINEHLKIKFECISERDDLIES